LRQLEYERLGAPYGVCVNEAAADTPYYYDRRYYSVDACYRSCSQYELLKKCGCGDPRTAVPDGVNFCDVDKKDCVDDFYDNYDSNVTCNCPLKCSEVEYTHTTTFYSWPAKYFDIPTCQKEMDPIKKAACVHRFRRNYVRLNVFFGNLNFEKLVEQPAYPLPQLLSDMGNASGLYIGLSVVTFFEAIFAFGVLIFRLFKK